MKMENLRYYFATALLVFGSSGFYAAFITWVIDKIFPLTETVFDTTFFIVYFVISIAGLIYAIPRFRGVY